MDSKLAEVMQSTNKAVERTKKWEGFKKLFIKEKTVWLQIQKIGFAITLAHIIIVLSMWTLVHYDMDRYIRPLLIEQQVK